MERTIVAGTQSGPQVASLPASEAARVAVVIPCFRVASSILEVIARIGPGVDLVYVVDDACPERSGDRVRSTCTDPRVRVIRHETNQGVGGAVMTGYRAALADGADVVVKVDGDGQMAPELIPQFVTPLVRGDADYTKGNRFYDLDSVASMPRIRLWGNAILSIMSKLSTGYWNVVDPTNGYTAIHAGVLRRLPLDKVSRGYFFETDLLFRLNTLRAVVIDVPMDAVYGEETSSLRVSRVLGEFLVKHTRNLAKRIFYNYFLHDVSIASLQLLTGLPLLLFGLAFGAWHWARSASEGIATPTGTIMIAAVSLLTGVQFVLSFLQYDIASVPQRPVHRLLAGMRA